MWKGLLNMKVGFHLMIRIHIFLRIIAVLFLTSVPVYAIEGRVSSEHVRKVENFLLDRDFTGVFQLFDQTQEYSRFNDVIEIYVRTGLGEIESMEDELISKFRSKYQSFYGAEEVLDQLRFYVEAFGNRDKQVSLDLSDAPDFITGESEFFYTVLFGNRSMDEGFSSFKVCVFALAMSFQRDPGVRLERPRGPVGAVEGRSDDQSQINDFNEIKPKTTREDPSTEDSSDTGRIDAIFDQADEKISENQTSDKSESVGDWRGWGIWLLVGSLAISLLGLLCWIRRSTVRD